jgi:Microtubule binding
VACQPDGVSVALDVDGKQHAFSFDRVFGPQSTQEHVFSEVSELVQSALDGFQVKLQILGAVLWSLEPNESHCARRSASYCPMFACTTLQ